MLEQENPAGRDRVFLSHTFHEVTMYYPIRGLRTRQYKYLNNLFPELSFRTHRTYWGRKHGKRSSKPGESAMLGGRKLSKVSASRSGRTYDIKPIRRNLNNLAQSAQHKATLESMRAQVQQFRVKTKDPLADQRQLPMKITAIETDFPVARDHRTCRRDSMVVGPHPHRFRSDRLRGDLSVARGGSRRGTPFPGAGAAWGGSSQIDRLWADMFLAISYAGWAGAEMRAISAIDMALWDLAGKAHGVPVYQLLGGASRHGFAPTTPATTTSTSRPSPSSLPGRCLIRGFRR